MKREVGAFHSYLCFKITKKRQNCLNDTNKLIIKRSDFKRMLGWFNIPCYIQNNIIEEMKDMGLVSIKDKQNIIVKKKESDWFD